MKVFWYSFYKVLFVSYFDISLVRVQTVAYKQQSEWH